MSMNRLNARARQSGRERVVETARDELAAERVSERQGERRARRFVHAYVAVLSLAIVGFVVLGLLAHGGTVLLQADRPITHAIQSVHWPFYDWVLTHESDLGFAPLNVVSYVVVFAALYATGLRLEAVLAVASSVLAGLVGGAIKLLVGRVRPSGLGIHIAARLGGYSFPSGHVTQYTTLFGFAFYAVLVFWRGGLLRVLALAVLALIVLLVGPSRVYLGEHWPSDVLGAYLFAGVWLAGTIELDMLLRSRLKNRR